MSRNRFVGVMLLVLLAGRGVAAQETIEVEIAAEPVFQAAGAVYVGPGGGEQTAMLAVEPFEAAPPVLGAPYTAEAVTEVTQVLADGNRISHQTSASIARDGRGRIRREHPAMVLGPVVAGRPVPLVTISDPSTGAYVTLDLERRTAFRMQAPSFEASVERKGPLMGVRTAIVAGPHAVDSTEARTEPLGEQHIEGVRAEGTRTTFTIPAGAVGNDLPIEVVSERWYSPELQVVVLTRRSDPRFGVTEYRLTSIVRAEPPPDLFEVPSDFKIEGGGAVRVRRRP